MSRVADFALLYDMITGTAILLFRFSLSQISLRISDQRLIYKGQSELPLKLALIIFASIAERLETPILIMISRKKVFTVLGLIFIRFAISLLQKPCSNKSAACFSRSEKLNSWAIRGRKSNPEEPRSRRSSRAA